MLFASQALLTIVVQNGLAWNATIVGARTTKVVPLGCGARSAHRNAGC